MKNIIPLSEAVDINAVICGNKAASLGKMINKGFTVPQGLCLTKYAYRQFIKENDIDKYIISELGRKRYADMRWEELWDASLRIRNLFIKAAIPQKLKQEILYNINKTLKLKPLAIRSSSLSEDSLNASFAGIHESFINITSEDSILKCIKLVWASLWSDAALLYRDELSLSVKNSAMAVIIQEMIPGNISGIAFCESPYSKKEAIIESIYGLNKGLVDGDIEPDRYIIDKNKKKIKSITKAKHTRVVSPTYNGVKFVDIKEKKGLTLNTQQVENIFSIMEKIEEMFNSPQDIEWTIKDNNIYILQSRPITVNDNEQKKWYLSLKRSFDNLEKLAYRIEKEILPQMEKESNEAKLTNLKTLSDDDLIKEIERRNKIYNKWNEIYWEECIPFAHGVRLFATLYNDKIQPDDPFEFIELILPEEMKSTIRNSLIEEASSYLKNHPESIDIKGNIKDNELMNMINSIAIEIGITLTEVDEEESNKIINLVKEASKIRISRHHKKEYLKEKILSFLNSFPEEEKEYAYKIIQLAKKSYQLRDDDNIYLGKFSANISLALKEANSRLSHRFKDHNACKNAEEAILALRFPDYIPPPKKLHKDIETKFVLNMRQMRGQPAGRGIARGKARVIISDNDLYNMKKDEIIICDAIDPTMTFIIPIASAIVERRGGMLIHGAIIAREYGIPCVTGIPQATKFIKNGDDITVDGFYGLVTNHSRTIQ